MIIYDNPQEAFSLSIASIADDLRWILDGKDISNINEAGLIIFAKHLKMLHKSMCSYGIEYDDILNSTLGFRDYNFDVLKTIESCMAYSTESNVNNFKTIKNFLDAVYEADRDSWWYGLKRSLKLKLTPFSNNDVIKQFLINLISSLNINSNRRLYKSRGL